METEKRSMLVDTAFEMLMHNSKDMMFVKDTNSVYHAASLAFVKMVGKKSVDEVVGRTDAEIFEDKSLAKRYVADDKKLIKNGKHLVD